MLLVDPNTGLPHESKLARASCVKLEAPPGLALRACAFLCKPVANNGSVPNNFYLTAPTLKAAEPPPPKAAAKKPYSPRPGDHST